MYTHDSIGVRSLTSINSDSSFRTQKIVVDTVDRTRLG
jgi:hypothetical protein